MKKNLFVFLLLIIALPVCAQKPGFKMGFYDRDSLQKLMPEMKRVNDSAAALRLKLDNQIELMNIQYENNVKAYNEKKREWSPVLCALKQKEMNDLQTRISEFKIQADKEYDEYYRKLKAPVDRKIDRAAAEIADAKGYTLILDSSRSAGVLMYGDPAYDIFELMCDKLDIPLSAH